MKPSHRPSSQSSRPHSDIRELTKDLTTEQIARLLRERRSRAQQKKENSTGLPVRNPAAPKDHLSGNEIQIGRNVDVWVSNKKYAQGIVVMKYVPVESTDAPDPNDCYFLIRRTDASSAKALNPKWPFYIYAFNSKYKKTKKRD